MKSEKDIAKDFPILREKINGKGLSYLDNAATTQKPQAVIDAIANFYQRNNSNTHRSVHELADRATTEYENARGTVAKFIGAKTEEIIFTSGTTDSMNKLALSLKHPIQEGDEIILTEMEHHSNIIPWQELAKEKNAKIKWLTLTEDFRLDLSQLSNIVTKKTKILSLTHASNVLGTINPVKEIIAECKRINPKIIAIIDAAQTVPHQKVDVKELDCDFLAFSGHKTLGPMGIGVLYGKLDLLKQIPPFSFGGGMVLDVKKEGSSWYEVPYKFEAGTPNVAGAVGLAAAITYLNQIGLQNVEKQMHEISELALSKLQRIPHLTLFGPKDTNQRLPIFSFNIKGVHPHDVSEILNQEGVAIRGGQHCAKILFDKLGVPNASRASFYIYNTETDLNKLIKGIKKIKDIFKVD